MEIPNCKSCGQPRKMGDKSSWGAEGFKPWQKQCWPCYEGQNDHKWKNKISSGLIYIAEYWNDMIDQPIEGMYKVGLTRKGGQARMSELGDTTGPMKVHTLREWEVDDPEKVEDELHIMFEKYGICGEWFNISKEVIIKECDDYIQAISR